MIELQLRRLVVKVPADSYVRKISSEEEEEGYILILKDKLEFFPALGTSFKLTTEGKPRRVRVESYPCDCRGPALPHEHYYVTWPGVRAGETVTIRRNSDSLNEFTLSIHH